VKRPQSRQATEELSLRLSRVGGLFRAMTANLNRPIYRPFLPNFPALDEFPFSAWRKCRNRAARSTRDDVLGYGDPAGFSPLKRCIAEYLALHRGDKCDPEQIVITPGGHAAFMLAGLLLANPGDKVWFEDPGPLTVRNLLSSLGLQVADVDVDEEGMDVTNAVRLHPDARLAFAMPSRQHPLGITLSLPRRLAMLEWARQYESWIIEDDYDSEFRYVGRPLPSMRSVDGAGRVIYVGTFSKALFPSIRIGYLVLPPALVGIFRNAVGLIARSVPVETQAVLADFIGEGYFVTHLRRMRDLYTHRRADFIGAAQEILSGLVEFESPESGMNVVAWLTSGMNDVSAHLDAVSREVFCYPLSDYAVRTHAKPALILGFTGVKSRELRPALKRLAEALARDTPSR
jgi:GntR family transcriptional regulator/MocR family aminotransferase